MTTLSEGVIDLGHRKIVVPAPKYYHMVPKEPRANLKWRRELLAMGSSSKKDAQDIWQMCSEDILFFFNSFVWTYDPRLAEKGKQSPVIPFLTYDFQDGAFRELDACIGVNDVAIEKSRDMGASWMCLGVFAYRWLFDNNQTFLMVSRNESYVDDPANPKSLFWKIDFIRKYLPPWLAPSEKAVRRTLLKMANRENGCTIDGESTTGDVARGDRRTAILLDEFAAVPTQDGFRALKATQNATDSRMFNSTPQGSGNAHAQTVNQPGVHKIRLHWCDHPKKNQGLYRVDRGKVTILDKSYSFPSDYRFITDGPTFKEGGLRSVYYDRECERTPIPSLIAQELDIDYIASGGQFFDQAVLTRAENEDMRPAYCKARMEVNMNRPDDFTFVKDDSGDMLLWCYLEGHPDRKPLPPQDRYYGIGVDVSTGTGASNSCISVLDFSTNEKVFEWATPTTRPDQLAKYAYVLGRYIFRGKDGFGARIIWESRGPGLTFGSVLIDDLKYMNVYYKSQEDGVSKKQNREVPGYPPTPKFKVKLLGDYQMALATGELVIRSKSELQECKEFIHTKNDGVEHMGSIMSEDPSGAKGGHGDRTMATALALVLRRFGPSKHRTSAPVVPKNSLAGLRRMLEDQKPRDDFGLDGEI